MFLDFFYLLRAKKIPVTGSEYLDLLLVLNKITIDEPERTLNRFYELARSCLIKDIRHYDAYDLTFAEMFGGLEGSSFHDKLKDWLEKSFQQNLSESQKTNALNLPTEELLKELEKRLKEQKGQHDGGNKWIGTGGTSPFGHSGYNPNGIRIGGQGASRSALTVAGERHFRDYRADETLHVRQMKVALKRLRELRAQGRPKLCIHESIKKTCRNGGEIELVLKKSRKNQVRVILLMDVGGSMSPHSLKVERLFSAANQLNHFKEFRYFYFHNIFYERVYKDASLQRAKSITIENLIKNSPSHSKVIIIGDALMAPYELFSMNQNIYDSYRFYGRAPHTSSTTAKE